MSKTLSEVADEIEVQEKIIMNYGYHIIQVFRLHDGAYAFYVRGDDAVHLDTEFIRVDGDKLQLYTCGGFVPNKLQGAQ